ncbi:MAG: beta-propeller fold lactonase family protein [Steroidobacter sp.]
MTSARMLRGTLALVVTMTLAACGGGGGGGDGGSSPPPNPPAPNPPATQRTIGGSITGLNGSGLVLQNNAGDNLAVTTNGSFTFANSIAEGSAYSVSVLNQPSTPEQTCVVSNGGGTVGGANVTTVAIACSTDTFTVSANVTGLTGVGLFVTNGRDRVRFNTNGSTTFDTRVASGSRYNVLIDTEPTEPAQRCTVANGNGLITDANVTVEVACRDTAPTFAYALNQGDGTLASYAIEAGSGQLHPRFVAKTGATPAQVVTYRPANGNQFSYVSNQDTDNVSGFELDPRSGVLTEISGSPFASGGDRPATLTLHPTRPFLYALNEDGASIAAYPVSADTGVLTPLGPVTTGAAPRAFAIDASGRFAYVAASGSSELYTYAIDQTTGALSEVSNSRVSIGTSFGGLTLDRDGHFAYSFDPAGGSIRVFALDVNTGAPTQINGSPFAAGSNVALLAVHPNGRLLFTRRGTPAQDTANGIGVFAIDVTTGALSEIAGSPFDVDANPIAAKFDSRGRNLYVGHVLTGGTPEYSVRAYSVSPFTSALTPFTHGPFEASAAPVSLDVDASERFLYVANDQSNQVTAYKIDIGDGTLTRLETSPNNTGFKPVAIATAEDRTPVTLSSKFVYTTDPAGSIRSFTIAEDGTLNPGATPSIGATAPLGITLDPRGRFAYVADPGANAIRIYAVGSTGALTATADGPVNTGGNPQYVAIEPSGRFAYVSIPSTSTIVRYTIDAATGNLTSPAPKTVTGDVQDLAITPNGKWLIATPAGGTAVRSYPIVASTGALGTEVSLDIGNPISSLAFDASGRFAYITSPAADPADAELFQYEINSQTGALTQLGSTSYGGIGVPTGVAVDPKGMFVFTADSSGDSVSVFSITGSGTLAYRNSTPAGTNPIAITTDYTGDFVRVTTSSGELITFHLDREFRTLTPIDTETGVGAIAEPATIVTSSHAE